MVLLDPRTWLTSQDPLRVVALPDPAVEAVGHEPRSRYVEVFYLGILGPSAVVTARHLAARLEASPDGFAVPLAVLARQLGLGAGTGRNAPLTKTLARLAGFGLAAVRDDAYALRLAFPLLADGHLRRLPPHLVVAHELMKNGAVNGGVMTGETLRC